MDQNFFNYLKNKKDIEIRTMIVEYTDIFKLR